MSRAEVESDIRETLGLVPEFFAEVPDALIETEWASFFVFLATSAASLISSSVAPQRRAASVWK